MLLSRLLIRARSVPGAFDPLTRHPQPYSPYTARPPDSLIEGISVRIRKIFRRCGGRGLAEPTRLSPLTLVFNRYSVKPNQTMPAVVRLMKGPGISRPEAPATCPWSTAESPLSMTSRPMRFVAHVMRFRCHRHVAFLSRICRFAAQTMQPLVFGTTSP